MATQKYTAPNTIATIFSTELNSMADQARVITSAAYDNETDLFLWATFGLSVTFAANPSANKVMELYLVPTIDGTNYADGGTSVTPHASALAAVFPLADSYTAQRIIVRDVELPPLPFKVLLRNDSGQALTASGHTLRFRRYNVQSV